MEVSGSPGLSVPGTLLTNLAGIETLKTGYRLPAKADKLA